MVMFGQMPTIIYGTYKLYITFDQAPGVTEGTPVRKSGILIGRVSNVRFSDDDTKVEVMVAIQKKFRLHKNEVCRVQSNLLGDASLEFIRSPDSKRFNRTSAKRRQAERHIHCRTYPNDCEYSG